MELRQMKQSIIRESRVKDERYSRNRLMFTTRY